MRIMLADLCHISHLLLIEKVFFSLFCKPNNCHVLHMVPVHGSSTENIKEKQNHFKIENIHE